MPFTVTSVLICLGIGLVVGFLAASALKSALKSVGFKSEANFYRRPDDLNVTEIREVFLYRTVDKTRIERNEKNKELMG